jgi:hypothetical protein
MMIRLPHPRTHLLFLLLSLADLGLTWVLIRHGLGFVYEGNPVAAWCLGCQGWAGLAVFKAVMVLTCSGLSAAISRRRPCTGGRVLAVSCVVTAAVVLYSGYLALACAGPLGEVRDALERGDWAETELDRVSAFLRLQDRLADDLAAGRCSLAQALAEDEPAAQAQDAGWQKRLRESDPARSPRECLALRLMRDSVAKRGGDPEAARALAVRLDGEYRSLFGTSPQMDRLPSCS